MANEIGYWTFAEGSVARVGLTVAGETRRCILSSASASSSVAVEWHVRHGWHIPYTFVLLSSQGCHRHSLASIDYQLYP